MTDAERGLGTLTEKEKQTLRLIVRGHDAKSIARSLDLSVHTINERLRNARRKVAVSSSREAARLLFEADGGMVPPAPNSIGDTQIGEGAMPDCAEQGLAPTNGAGQALRPPWIMIGVVSMIFALALLTMTALPLSPPTAPQVATEAPDSAVVDTARRWLALLDQSNWDESYWMTGVAFQKLNTPTVWAAVSERVRKPLGAMISRTLIGQENLPAPPDGYEVVKFRTRFANKADTVETVTLDREDGGWRVVGVTVG